MVIANKLRASDDDTFTDVSLDVFRSDFTKPILSIKPKGSPLYSSLLFTSLHINITFFYRSSPYLLSIGSKFVVRLIPCISKTVFPLSKLMPDHNNVRLHVVDHSIKSTDNPLLFPTPHYNNAILEDIFLIDNFNLLKQNIDSMR